MPTMMDNTRESSQMQLCLCVKWFHLLAHCLVMSLSVLHGYFQNGILQSMHYYILPTLFFLIVIETVVSYFNYYSMNSSDVFESLENKMFNKFSDCTTKKNDNNIFYELELLLLTKN